ncbi:MAG: GNAT family N-acetyltransferase [Firmicutes bacterium]|nr:GNAT family N-acetyltransferase [Bacillota bacterium]
MKYIKADIKYAERIFRLVHSTIIEVYPKYYPQEVADFFCELHNKESIIDDINNGSVYILIDEDRLVGTGSRSDNHITRIYVLPDFQDQGYGSYIMRMLEKDISLQYDKVYLEASFPAAKLYEYLGYKTVRHEKLQVSDNAVLVYEIMEKRL